MTPQTGEMIITRELEQKSTDMMATATNLVVADNTGYNVAANFLKGLKGLQKQIGDTFDPIVESAHKTWKEAIAQRSKFLSPTENAERLVKQKMGDYQLRLEQKRREDERLAQAAADQAARKQREELEARAKKAEEKGKTEKAEALREQAEDVFVPAPVIPATAPKTDGIKTTFVWKFELVPGAEGSVPRSLCSPDVSKIRAHVKLYGNTKPVPGVRIYQAVATAAGVAKE